VAFLSTIDIFHYLPVPKLLIMKKIFLLSMTALALQSNAQLKYPQTRKEVVTDDYHGTKVEDPYRWLEDDNSNETKDWVKAENVATQGYLSTIPFRAAIRTHLEKMWNFPKYGSPFKRGAYYYFYKNNGLQNQSILYRQKGLTGVPEVFIDPNKLTADGTAALQGLSFSKNYKYAAYSVARSGSDWQKGFVMDVATKQLVTDSIEWIKFSGFSWKGDDGFYYSGYDKPDEKTALTKANEYNKVMYHKMGTAQSADALVFVDKAHALRYQGAGLTEDNRFLILSSSEGTSGGEVQYWDLKDASQTGFKMLVEGFATEPNVIENVGDKLLLQTNDGAPNYKVVLVDPKNPAKENWKIVIPEQKEALQGVSTGGGFLFASYLKDASTKIYQYTMDGKLIREVSLPGIGTASGIGGEMKDKDCFYSFSSYNYPASIFRFDMASGKSTLFKKSEVKFDATLYETKQVFFTSKDGTKVPMFISSKKGLKLDGNNPVLMYGYGGFNIPMTPGFSVGTAFWMSQGGVYVVVNLRGGSEYGEDWHKAAILEKKQNVFDDFIGAAEFLIANKYTNSNRLAIQGGSNGGLLVGACMTQRPELFKVALPAVGVMDMLRFHKFTVGWGWCTEYGCADSAMQFPYLFKYSPYHNLKPNTSYPATMVTTADHDDRVVPAHSFKYAARLQDYHTGANPVLIRIESKAGHGAGTPLSKTIEQQTDIWSFVMFNLGMKPNL
jgi:prolyl oligopeptidase